MNEQRKEGGGGRRGFTLVEVLASMAVLVILVLALTRMFGEAANIVKRGSSMLARNSMGSTAMETILQDIEGMAVSERLACRFLADASDEAGFGFDEAWFITTSGDQDDGRAYQTVHYYVTNSMATNSLGAQYRRFQLIRQVGVFANADNNGVDIMELLETAGRPRLLNLLESTQRAEGGGARQAWRKRLQADQPRP